MDINIFDFKDLPECHLQEETRPSVFASSLGEMTTLKRLPHIYIKSFSLPTTHRYQWQRTYTTLASTYIFLPLFLFLVNVIPLAHKIRNTASYQICINGQKNVNISTYKFEDHGMPLFFICFSSFLYIIYSFTDFLIPLIFRWERED